MNSCNPAMAPASHHSAAPVNTFDMQSILQYAVFFLVVTLLVKAMRRI
jgi:hypothetical protein